MGINRKTQKPCGFCFLEYTNRKAAEQIISMSPHIIQGKELKIDWDYGFRPGRQWGRGRFGG